MNLENFTAHAVQRLSQRTRLSLWELNYLFHNGLFVDLGTKPGINKNHYLFYSKRDDDCFVAVLDSLDGSVITVWLMEYHENLGWPIEPEEKALAKEKVQNFVPKNLEKEPSVYKVAVGYTTQSGQSKVKIIFSVQKDDMEEHPISIYEKDKLHKFVMQETLDKAPDATAVHWLSIRLGKNFAPIVVTL